MGQVTVTLNGRNYRLLCGDGEEPRLLLLSNHLRAIVDDLVRQFGQAGDDRLLAMAALIIADELFELRAKLGEDAAAAEAVSSAPREALAGPRTARR